MVITEKDFNELKNKFIACDYIENSKIKVEDGKTTHEDSILGIFCDRLGINIHGKTRNFINDNLIGFSGNKSIRVVGSSYKIFEILNLIMEILKKDLTN